MSWKDYYIIAHKHTGWVFQFTGFLHTPPPLKPTITESTILITWNTILWFMAKSKEFSFFYKQAEKRL